ncbi:hypothetical protein [Bradyrhizobium sp. USDA 3240]
MQTELARRLKSTNLSASSTAGLGSVFAAVGDRHLKEGGRLSLVLPAALTAGIAWGKTRDLINRNYILETVIVSHDPERWNFSENTDLSEVMLIARKRKPKTETDAVIAAQPTQFINLWRNPRTSAHALAAGEQISRGAAAPIGTPEHPQHGVSEIVVGSEKYGETIEIPWGEVREAPWIGGAFAQTNLIRTAWMMRQGRLYFADRNDTVPFPVSKISDIGLLGPDRRDIADGFTVSTSRSRYPALMGHAADEIRSINVDPNKWLSPRATAAAGRPLRDVATLWQRAGTIMIAERSWLNTQRTLAVRTSRPALSNVWWPLRLRKENEAGEKALALWLNSTLGLLASLAHRVPTRGAWIQFKKPTIENMAVLDVLALAPKQLRQVASAYDSIAARELDTIVKMATDPVRADIDDLFSKILGIPSVASLRNELAEEPIIKLRSCNEEEPTIESDDQFQFELM